MINKLGSGRPALLGFFLLVGISSAAFIASNSTDSPEYSSDSLVASANNPYMPPESCNEAISRAVKSQSPSTGEGTSLFNNQTHKGTYPCIGVVLKNPKAQRPYKSSDYKCVGQTGLIRVSKNGVEQTWRNDPSVKVGKCKTERIIDVN